MLDLYPLVGPIFRSLPAEFAHRLTVRLLKLGLAPTLRMPEDPRLAVTLWGLHFANPVGLAAGYDKNAEAVNPLLAMGFGSVEIGSVTPRPQPGNPKPRLFRLPADRAIINRMGFNNDGLAVVADRLCRRPRRGILGINLGRNKDTEDAASDYEKGVAALGPLADYLVINVSSPNTPGLRALQGRAPLEELIGRVQAALSDLPTPPPLLVKIAPDLTDDDLGDIAAVALGSGLHGLIISNTTIARPASLRAPAARETGGLSGRPLFEPATRALREIYHRTEGKIPLIGVGGIESTAQAYAKIRAGASLVQLYSALVYQGPALVARIRRELPSLLDRDGFATIRDAIGADHRGQG